MTTALHGHVDIVRMLIEAKANINAQEVVCYSCSPIYTVSWALTVCMATVCGVPLCNFARRMVQLLFTWQLKKVKLVL